MYINYPQSHLHDAELDVIWSRLHVQDTDYYTNFIASSPATDADKGLVAIID